MRYFIAALLGATALAGISAQSVTAADLQARAPMYTKAPAYLPYNWTGFYAGVNVGYGWASADATATLAGVTGTGSETLNGIIGGGQIGYNWQTSSNIVLGIEGDIQASGQSNTTNGTLFGAAYSETDKITYFGTIRGRLGYAIDRWMPYVTGGWGYGEFTSDATINGLGTFSSSNSHGAWVVGGGVEAALVGNWTAKVEYLYLDTGDITNTYATGLGTLTTTSSVKDNIIRAGLNYRF